MGNVQFLHGMYPSDDLVNFIMSSETSFEEDSGGTTNTKDKCTSISARNNKVACEYCQEFNVDYFHEQHMRICPYNPMNLRENLQFQFSRGDQSILSLSNSELEKTVCEFCNEPCFAKFQCNHRRICAKNPENIKVTCRYCNRTLNLIMYQNHLRSCEYTQGQRRRSVDAHAVSAKDNQSFPSSLRRVKTNNDIEMANAERRKSLAVSVKDHELECCICLDVIKSRLELRTLRCFHQYHKKCIENWSLRQRKCPICRKGFL